MTPEEYCQDKTANSGSSFYYSFLFLDDERRRAITAVYAFCREVDDVVDNPGDMHVKQIKLQWWRNEIENLYQDQPQHPVTRALTPVIQQYHLPQEYFHEIIDGMEMDLEQTRYETFTELSLYCYRAAGVVGLIAAEIFGYEDKQTRKYAVSLGTAFQLTNILRDIREDARRGRIYLPKEDLQRFSINAKDLALGENTTNFRQLMRYEINRARNYYQQAFDQLPDKDRYPQRCGLIMADIYSALLDRIAKQPEAVLHQRLGLKPLKKFWIAFTGLHRERRRYRKRIKQHG